MMVGYTQKKFFHLLCCENVGVENMVGWSLKKIVLLLLNLNCKIGLSIKIL